MSILIHDPELTVYGCNDLGDCYCNCGYCECGTHCWKHWNDCHVKCGMLR